MRKWFVFTLLIVLVAVSAACGKSASNEPGNASAAPTDNGQAVEATPTAPAKNVKLVFWNTIYKTIDANDKSKKPEDFYIYKAVERYEQAHPGITIDIQNMPGGDDSFTKFRAASIAKNGPDINTIWTGTYLYAMKQFAEPLDDYLKNSDLPQRIVGWNTTNEMGQGPTVGIPAGNDGLVVLFYNKDMLAKAGLNFDENPPQNIDQLMQALQKLKGVGVDQPLALDENNNFWFLPAYWISQSLGTEGVADLLSGKLPFDSPQIANVLNKEQELQKNKYITTSDSKQQFLQEQSAMTIRGSSFLTDAVKVLGDKLGMVKLPDFDADVKVKNGGIGGVGTAFMVTNYSAHKQEAFDFIQFLLSKDEQEKLLESKEKALTVAKDVDFDQVINDPFMIKAQQWSTEDSALPYLDNLLPVGVTSEISKMAPLALKGQTSTDDFLKDVDGKMKEALAGQ